MNEPVRGWVRRARTRRGLLRDLLKILALLVFFVALAMLVESQWLRESFDLAHWRGVFSRGEHVGGRGMGMLLFVLAGAAMISAGLPRVFVAALGGGIYGALIGATFSLLSALIGAALVFALGHRVLRGIVDRRIGGRLEQWRERFREQAFWWVLYGRLFPFTNSTLNSLLCGACEVPFRPYIMASAIGFIPLSVVFALFGSGGAKASYTQVLLAAGLLLVTVVVQNFLHRVFPGDRSAELGPEAKAGSSANQD